ncbi:hypothetical protein CRE_30423 [Caenorhabditis remanei]|uniref:Serine/threonine specific protein phosphatases domain-containing protein n=1 Tax=Caenorhabditis remanei TaxID=31234 RepID=E3NAG5_CAERE|nr:hypothetical protein CRE_30423 [Caenorhabditis remanei]
MTKNWGPTQLYFSKSSPRIGITRRRWTSTNKNSLAEHAKEHFKSEPVLAKISPPVIVVGGVHGQYADLGSILNSRFLGFVNYRLVFLEPSSKCIQIIFRFVFLGDYVDRGENAVACIALLFALKIHFPKQYVLLRGNNETKTINNACKFREELVKKIGEDDGRVGEIPRSVLWMPLACWLEGVLTMHGGISTRLENWKNIENIQRPLVDVNVNQLACDLI